MSGADVVDEAAVVMALGEVGEAALGGVLRIVEGVGDESLAMFAGISSSFSKSDGNCTCCERGDGGCELFGNFFGLVCCSSVTEGCRWCSLSSS